MGSAVALLNSRDFSKLQGLISTLKALSLILKSHTRDIIECLGKKHMEVKSGRPGQQYRSSCGQRPIDSGL